MSSLPKTVGDAANQVISALDGESLGKLRQMEESDLVGLHFGLAMWIRNAFGLWGDNRPLLEDCSSADGYLSSLDPDEASMVILRAAWRRVRQ